MKIEIDELQTAFILLTEKLKENNGNVIEINNDFYWDIISEQIYNPYQKPEQLTLGQLSDDISEIKNMVKDSSKAIPYDLKRVSNIIKVISIEHSTAF